MESWHGLFDEQAMTKGFAVAGQLFRSCTTLRRVCFYSNGIRQGISEDACFFRLDSGEAAFEGSFGFKNWREWQDMI